MKQFIRYLYEYGQGKKARNVGFVKVEQDDSESTIHIHGKGLRLGRNDSLRVYLIFEDGGQVTGVPQGEIAYMGPSINYRLDYTREDTGIPENFDRVNGILLENKEGRKFAALWEETRTDVENMHLWTGNTAEKPMEEAPDQNTDNGTGTAMQEEDAVLEAMPDMALEAETDVFSGDEQGMESDEGMEDVPDTAVEVQEEGEEEASRLKVTKIKRNEISRLPRCEWRLANNNFLLHGYYNYHYLVLLDDGNMLRLGVPGIYHEKEAMAATGLGFPEFIGADETALSDEDESGDGQRFGFWCRQVRRPVR